jgi:AraC family transcriptional regulator
MKLCRSPAHPPSESDRRFESHCVALENVGEIAAPGGAGVIVLVVVGACSVQRRVHGEWAEHLSLPDGGVLVADSTDSIRLVGRVANGVAVFVSKAAAKAHLGHLRDDLDSGRLVRLSLDAVVLSLAKVLVTAMRDGADGMVTENVMDILVTRLGQVTRQPFGAEGFERTTLPNWRLRRVIQHVDERLDTGISLADMAAVAGLSAMHFAAQFKAATGMRPHHYLVARRIQHAKQLLNQSEHSVLDVALAVGFRTQSHFTTVFKRHESMTPARWRRDRLAA